MHSDYTAGANTKMHCDYTILIRSCILSECTQAFCLFPLNFAAQLENSKEGIIWSILSVPAVSYRDTGKYICKATNYAGSAEAVISLIISDTPKAENLTVDPKTKVKSKKPNPIVKAAYQEKHIATYVSPTPKNALPLGATVSYTGPFPGMESDNAANSRTNTQTASPDGFLETNLSNLAANTSSLQQDPDRVVRSVKVIGDTDYTVCLNWRAPTAKSTTAFSVLYAVFGERDMRRINVSPGNNRIIIEGLVPKTKYIACVCVKGLIPKKEQCVIFSTDAAASANGTQKLINVVVITVACVIAVPLTVIVCCGALKRKIKKFLGKKSKDIQDSYVTFETLSPSTKAKGLEGEYLNRLNAEESNRLLSDRSSLDSESTAKIEGQPNEYFCWQYPSATIPPRSHHSIQAQPQYLSAHNLYQQYMTGHPWRNLRILSISNKVHKWRL